MIDQDVVRSLATYAGLKLDRADELADVRDLLELVVAHRSALDALDLGGTRPSHVFCFHHAAREHAGK
jgi:hypothetical protein